MDIELSSESKANLEYLIKKITSYECSIFVGAGLSMPAGYPSWGTLISQLQSAAVEGLGYDPCEPSMSNLIKAEKYREMDSMKSRFFANISHEFRTPLTLILGPVEKLLAKADGRESAKDLKLIKRNARRLFNLINQLLDLSKLEANKMSVRAGEHNIVPFIKGLVMSFVSLAERKNIILTG